MRMYNDSVHIIADDVKLNGGAKLHRFNNEAGCAYSAIYVGETEVWSQTRENEKRMIKQWNAGGWRGW